jgi:hypothetical protein
MGFKFFLSIFPDSPVKDDTFKELVEKNLQKYLSKTNEGVIKIDP